MKPVVSIIMGSTSDLSIFWATIEHSLNYKYQGEYPQEILERLERASEAAFRLDEEMSEIRDEIREALLLFDKR